MNKVLVASFLGVFTLVGCVNLKHPVVLKPTATAPEVVELSFGGPISDQYRYVASGSHVYREVYRQSRHFGGGSSYPLRQRTERAPTTGQWNAFQRTIQRLDVVDWKRQYHPDDVNSYVNDGRQWSLKISTTNRNMEFEGYEAYPAIGHPKQTTLESKAFDELEKAFEALLRTPET